MPPKNAPVNTKTYSKENNTKKFASKDEDILKVTSDYRVPKPAPSVIWESVKSNIRKF